jgi:putative FmdB family regulatory protein
MPTYDYLCKSCNKEFETDQSIKDDAIAPCPTCKRISDTRLISTGGSFVLKGDGWAADNYAKKS